MKTAILLGAGSSIPAGYPRTNAITNLVLTGEGITIASDSSYYIEDNTKNVQDSTTSLANKMARKLHSEMKNHNEHYGMNQIPNYEEIAYLAAQGCSTISAGTLTPAAFHFHSTPSSASDSITSHWPEAGPPRTTEPAPPRRKTPPRRRPARGRPARWLLRRTGQKTAAAPSRDYDPAGIAGQ